MKKVLVTGANGFIGSYLCNRLIGAGCEVFAVVRDKSSNMKELSKEKNIRIVHCDMDNYNLLPEKIQERGFDAFYHLAWRGVFHGDKSDYVLQTDNCKNTIEAAKASKSLGCNKFITTGTMTEFCVDSMIEEKLFPTNLIYAASKQYLSKALSIYCNQNDINLIWATLANTYGRGNLTGNVISYILEEKEKGRTPQVGAGNFYYDFVHIKDCVEMLYLLGEKIDEGSFYIGSGQPKLLKDFFKDMEDVLNITIDIGAKNSETASYKKEWFDISKTTELLGYLPIYDFKKGIADMVKE